MVYFVWLKLINMYFCYEQCNDIIVNKIIIFSSIELRSTYTLLSF